MSARSSLPSVTPETRAASRGPAVRPELVSQLTSLQVLGVDGRRWLEAVWPRCAGATKLGKLRLASLDAALRVLAATEVAEAASDDAPDDLASVDAVLRAVGRRRV
jgi:hypothetical protein